MALPFYSEGAVYLIIISKGFPAMREGQPLLVCFIPIRKIVFTWRILLSIVVIPLNQFLAKCLFELLLFYLSRLRSLENRDWPSLALLSIIERETKGSSNDWKLLKEWGANNVTVDGLVWNAISYTLMSWMIGLVCKFCLVCKKGRTLSHVVIRNKEPSTSTH